MPDHDELSVAREQRMKTMLSEIIQVMQGKWECQAAERQIEEIEQRYVATAEGEERLDLQRSAARWAFIAATDLDGSFDEVLARYHRVCEIGFSSSQTELAVLVEFAYVCGSFGHWEEGLRMLAQARERLPAWGFKRQAEVGEMIDRLQRRLENREDCRQEEGEE